MRIEFKKVNKYYGDLHVLRDLDLSIDTGEKVVLIGPSGCGKSTLLFCINALERIQERGYPRWGDFHRALSPQNPAKDQAEDGILDSTEPQIDRVFRRFCF